MKSKIRGDYSRVNDEEKEFINERLANFEKNFESNFSDMHVKLDCQPEKETSRGRKKFICKISVSTDKGRFDASGEDFGVEKTIAHTLNKVERQIRK